MPREWRRGDHSSSSTVVFTDAGDSTTIPSVLAVAGIAFLAGELLESTDAASADARRHAGASDGTMSLR